MKFYPALVAAALCALSLSVSAQWQWIDKEGRKVFSDRPPPADVPERNILKQPGSHLQISDAPAAKAPAAPAPAATARPAGEDPALVQKKKQAADAEAAKRQQEDERVARIRADNCNRARQAKAGLEAGGRLSRINEKGERVYLDDAERAAEAQRLQGIVDDNCR
jgi:hypothetical protein